MRNCQCSAETCGWERGSSALEFDPRTGSGEVTVTPEIAAILGKQTVRGDFGAVERTTDDVLMGKVIDFKNLMEYRGALLT